MTSSNLSPVGEQVGQFYDQLMGAFDASLYGPNIHVGFWNSQEDTTGLEDAADRLTDMMIDRLQVGPGDRVLDIGCGLGGPAIRLAQRTGAEVVGISVSLKQVERANELAEAAGVSGKVSFQHGDAMNLPFDDASFSAVWMLESVMQMPDRTAALTEAARVLRPGGRLALTDNYERETISEERRPVIEGILKRYLTQSPASFEAYPTMLREAGLRCAEIIDVSENTTRQSVKRLGEALAKNMEQLAAKVDPEVFAKLKPAEGENLEMPEVGYLIVTARRPAA
ncbi:methyltransferase domain-containing protein [Streptomyces sp. SID486]|uniref:27-O-demethylrifamycin SV methyltransferase n=1 Tax=Streptomyces rameus TaxID=68261 RepID=A0ABP6NJC3_9ACTN|nr:methyltransferase domain-containing protein [Streptomyces sp. SID2955]MYW48679.1 methyltransferase domain-containing protein [Streptomyces sp. SID161]MYX97134.1 methyltransferase domain-containing protein [Streptomyces sp. SID486]